MTVSNAVVLLSGGLDSTAALCWARLHYTDVRALGVDYGQPNRDAEIYAARGAAQDLGIPYVGLAIVLDHVPTLRSAELPNEDRP